MVTRDIHICLIFTFKNTFSFMAQRWKRGGTEKSLFLYTENIPMIGLQVSPKVTCTEAAKAPSRDLIPLECVPHSIYKLAHQDCRATLANGNCLLLPPLKVAQGRLKRLLGSQKSLQGQRYLLPSEPTPFTTPRTAP